MGDTQEPQWLDDDQAQTWLALTAMMVRLPAALDAQLQRDAGISHFEYQVLAGLSMSPERTLRMSVLAGFAEGSLSRLSQVVARLAAATELDRQAKASRRRMEVTGATLRAHPTRPTAATPSPSSPTPAGTRSSPPPPGTSLRCND